MAKRTRRTSTPKYSRSARVSTTLQEIIADELVRIDDERLTFVTVTGIDVDPELNRANVFFDSLGGEDDDDEIMDALGEHRIRLQGAIARQIRAKKTPILDFRPDMAIRSAAKIDDILRNDRARIERESAQPLARPADGATDDAETTDPGSEGPGSGDSGSTDSADSAG